VRRRITLLEEAEAVARFLETEGIPVLLIGAGAMAVHHYIRFTRDLDIAVAVSVEILQGLCGRLQAGGWQAECRLPNHDDSLGGVVDIVTGPGLVQIINFGGTFPAPFHDALKVNPLPVRAGSPLWVMPLPYLIALKLYAGGRKSQVDILELLRYNPDLDRKELEALCRRYRLRGLKALLKESEPPA
jgi:hypothetical protein